MARIILPNGRPKELYLGKNYFQIGRHPDNDLPIKDIGISRFHATIFRTEEGGSYLINHGVNGTFYTPSGVDFKGKKTRLEDVTKTEEFKSRIKSHAEADEEQRQKRVNPIPGFIPHHFNSGEKVQYLIDMINNPQDSEFLTSLGVKLVHESNIGLPTIPYDLILVFIDPEQGR